MPRTTRVVAIVALTGALAGSVVAQSRQSPAADSTPPSWHFDSSSDIVRQYVQGIRVIDQFALVRHIHGCHDDLLWLEWFSTHSLTPFRGTTASLELTVDSLVVPIEIEILVAKPVGHVSGMALTNFVAGQQLIDLFAHSTVVRVTFVGPPALVDSLNIVRDYFSLRGFGETRDSLLAACARHR